MSDIHAKPKVLYIETGMGFGGAAVSLFEITSSLKHYEPVIAFYASKDSKFTWHFKNYNTYFLNAHFTYLHKLTFYKKLKYRTQNKLLLFCISKLYTIGSIIDDNLLLYKIEKIIKKENISIVHINNCIHSTPLKAAKRHNIPAIVYLRGHLDCYGKKKKDSNKLFQKLLVPTHNVRNYAIKKLGVDENKIKVIYDSVNPELYNLPEEGKIIRKKYNIPDSTVVIGIFARIIPMKGQLELAHAVHKLLSDEHDVICMFIGDISDGDIEYFKKLKNYIKNSNFPDRFIFTGYRSDAPAFFNAIDITAHASIASEAFGRVIIESWAAHKPVIATDIGASLELIDHESTGLIVPIGNIEKLYSAILRLIKNPDEREKLADNGYKRIQKYFCSETVTRSIEDIYTAINRHEP